MSEKAIRVFNSEDVNDLLSIVWDHSNICNFKCTYCKDEFNGGDKPFFSFEELLPFFSSLKSKAQNREIVWDIQGGEPTYWKDLPLFLEYANKQSWFITLVTNGSASIDWWQNNIKNIHNVVLSYHPEFSNQDHFDNIIPIITNKIVCSVSILLYPPFFNDVIKIALNLREKHPGVRIRLSVVNNPETKLLFPYTEKQIELIKKTETELQNSYNGNKKPFNTPSRRGKSFIEYKSGKIEPLDSEQIKLQELNKMKGWNCSAGITRLRIDNQGKVFRGKCRQGGQIGHISEEFELPTEYVTCEKEYCVCSPEIFLPKEMPTKSF